MYSSCVHLGWVRVLEGQDLDDISASRWMYVLAPGNDSLDLKDERAINKRIKLLLEQLTSFFHIIMPRHTLASACFMMSFFNLRKQQAHTDVCGILHASPRPVPGLSLAYSVIIASDDNTFLYVYRNDSPEPEKIHIPKNALLIFAADMIHAGMDLPNMLSNYRFHAILKSKEFSLGGDAQGWLRWDSEESKWKYEKHCERVMLNI